MPWMLILSCVTATIADMLFVWWAKKNTHPAWALIAGLILLNLTAYIWALSLRKGIESASAITIYAIATVIGCSWLGIVIFKEPLSPVNGIGIALGMIALILVSL